MPPFRFERSLVASFSGPGHAAAVATAVNNAASYPAFYLVSLIGFRLYRSVSAQSDALRRIAAGQAAENARLQASARFPSVLLPSR